MKPSELRQIIREEIKSTLNEVGGGKNPEADKKVNTLVRGFSKSLDISPQEAAELIKASLKRLGY
jgi:hypothetical protein